MIQDAAASVPEACRKRAAGGNRRLFKENDMRLLLVLTLSFLATILSSCSAPNIANFSSSTVPIAATSRPRINLHGRPKTGPGKVLSSAYGGQILGFDIDQNGTDGLLTESLTEGSKLLIGRSVALRLE